MLTKDRLNARVRDQRLILEAMTPSVAGADDLAREMLRLAHASTGETYAALTQAWQACGEGTRLLPFFRDAMSSHLLFTTLEGDPVARRQRFIEASQRIRREEPTLSYEVFRARLEKELGLRFEEIEASLYGDLEDFRIVKGCALSHVTEVFTAYHTRQLELMIDHAEKVLFSPTSKGRRFSGGEELACGDGKKLLGELRQRGREWTLAITLKFSGKERTCLFSPAEFPLHDSSRRVPGRGEPLNPSMEM